MKIYNRHINLNRMALCAALAATFILPTSCGGSKEEHQEKTPEEKVTDDHLYDHIDKIVDQYGTILLATPPDGQEMEALLMDINSRCEMLMAQGDTLKALYFHHAIEQNVRKRDSVFADRIFGKCPYTAFSLERE